MPRAVFLLLLVVFLCITDACRAKRPVPIAPQSTDRIKFVREFGSDPIEDKSLLNAEGLQLHSIFAHHVSHAGEATLVHRVVPPQKKRENENDEGMDEQNENKRRTLLYDRDGPSNGPTGEPRNRTVERVSGRRMILGTL